MPKRGLLIGALAVSTLLVVVGANGAGMINNPAAGYLLCINTKTKVVTHPGTSNCPKGTKGLVVGSKGQDGAAGLTGATGLNGQNGRDGLNGKTLWNGTKDPENTWGSPGDMFINSITKTLFGPKNLDGTWPVGVSIVGPKGDQGLTGLTGATGPQGPSGGSGPAGPAGTNGINATIAITELFECDGPDAGTVANEKCKIGMTGPGGGTIFFVDYNDIYPTFNYLEAAPTSCESAKTWSSENTAVTAARSWAGRAVGAGQANTTAIKAAFASDTSSNNAAYFATSCSAGGKSDWFLGSLGEMKLMFDNLQGVAGFMEDNYYWSSAEFDTNGAWGQFFGYGLQGGQDAANKANHFNVRPVRAF